MDTEKVVWLGGILLDFVVDRIGDNKLQREASVDDEGHTLEWVVDQLIKEYDDELN